MHLVFANRVIVGFFGICPSNSHRLMPCFKFPSEQLKSNRRSAPRLTKIHSGGVTTAAGSRVKNNDGGALGKGDYGARGQGLQRGWPSERTASERRGNERECGLKRSQETGVEGESAERQNI